MKHTTDVKVTRAGNAQADSFTAHHDYYQPYHETVKANPQPEKGKVFIVGAGPSDPDLLTVKALKAIQKAQVLVYDRLVSREIIELANPEAELVYVGKRCGSPSMTQETINQILVDYAQQNKQVVRLKGGDPFIFGRGGEEALELVKHKIPYEVIPGITAAVGCASSALIPLTHRKVSRSVTFITGHVVEGALPSWAGLVQSGQTLVFYMGLEKSHQIETGLTKAGLSGETPFAIIGKGCSQQQEVFVGKLSELNEMAIALKGLSPALLILGDVVKLREQLLFDISEINLQALEA